MRSPNVSIPAPLVGVIVVYGDTRTIFVPDGYIGTDTKGVRPMTRETIRGLLKGALASIEAEDE